MNAIVQKRVLSEQVKLMVVKAPMIATKAKAGQFVIVRINETGERIPLTIADNDPAQGTITLIFQEVGKSTMQMGELEVGQGFENVVGPLGTPTEVENYGKVVLVGGGIGIAPLHPIARALKQAGNNVHTIIGARTKDLLFWEEQMQVWSDKLTICTDDGSYGRHGLVTEPLKEILESEKDIAHVWAIGPGVMMKAVANTTRPYNVPTTVSLNTVMIDGTGMCGGCRVMTSDGAKFVCVDGPELDAHIIDWDNMLQRLSFYRADEKLAVERMKRHNCNLDQAFEAASR
jgi:ferredoxin/flavodoxin---NADP+ reductase